MNLKAFLIGCLLLAGCASAPQFSFSDALGAGYASVDALADATLDLCGAVTLGGECTGRISTETRDQVRMHLATALELLDEARLHQTGGSPDLAQQRISEARTFLALVERLIEVRA